MRTLNPEAIPSTERRPSFFNRTNELSKNKQPTVTSESTITIYEEALSKVRTAVDAENLLEAAIYNNSDTEKSYATVLDLMYQEKNMQGMEKIAIMAMKANKLGQKQKEKMTILYQKDIDIAAQKNNLFHVRTIFNQASKHGFIDLIFLRNVLSLKFTNAKCYVEEIDLYNAAFTESQKLSEKSKDNKLQALIENRYKQIIEDAFKKNQFTQLKEIYIQIIKNGFEHLIDFNRFISLANKNNDLEFGIGVFEKARKENKLTKTMYPMMSELFVKKAEQLVYEEDSSRILKVFDVAAIYECVNSKLFNVLLSHLIYVKKFDVALEIFKSAVSQGKADFKMVDTISALHADLIEQAASKKDFVKIKELCQQYSDLDLSLNDLYKKFHKIFPKANSSVYADVCSAMMDALDKANKRDDVVLLDNYRETQERSTAEKELTDIKCEPRSFKL